MDAVRETRGRDARRALRRGAGRLALLALCWIVMTGGVFSGCKGLFTPAVPEAPTGPPLIPNYRSPELTLRTMKEALAAKARGSSAWLGAFADSSAPGVPGYHQFFDPTDLSVFGSSCGCQVPSDWSLTQEQTFYLQFLNVRPSDNYQAVFDSVADNPDPPPTDDTHAVLHRHYQLIATSPDGNSTLIIAIGYADLTLTKVGDQWLITRWDDHVDPLVTANPIDPYQLTLGRRRLEASQ
jgi:hypothetical protein